MGSITMALFIEEREFNDYKKFVTEIEDLEKKRSVNSLKKEPNNRD